ncbi:Beta-amyrin 28-monooxygenase-like protein, partial [Drosera capensis]
PIISYILYRRNSNANLPPGNLGLPLLGENIKFFSDSKKGWPEKFIFERMSRFSPLVFKTSLLGEQTMIFCGQQGHKFLFGSGNKYVTGWMPKSMYKIFQIDENEKMEEIMTLGRKVVVDVIRPEFFSQYTKVMDTVAQRHFATSWESKEEVHAYPLAKRYTFLLACQLFLSIDDPEEVKNLSDPFETFASGLISLPIDLPGTSFNRGLKSSAIIHKKIREIIRQRKREIIENREPQKQDILSHMLSFVDENGKQMGEISITTNILGTIFAGYDTASTAITTIVKYLAELPHVYDQVYKEQMDILRSKGEGELLNWGDIQKMQYSWNVVCEALRLASPGQGFFRVAIEDFDYEGFTIPKGSKLYWTVNSTHKNPKYFPDPENFDPSRFDGKGPAPYTFVPFGGGPRMCPGRDYARLEILVFIHNIVKRFKWEKIVADERIVIDPFPRPTHRLPIRLLPHKI